MSLKLYESRLVTSMAAISTSNVLPGLTVRASCIPLADGFRSTAMAGVGLGTFRVAGVTDGVNLFRSESKRAGDTMSIDISPPPITLNCIVARTPSPSGASSGSCPGSELLSHTSPGLEVSAWKKDSPSTVVRRKSPSTTDPPTSFSLNGL